MQRSPGMMTWYLGFDAATGAVRRCPRPPCLRARDRPARRRPSCYGAAAAETGGLLPPTMPGHSNRVAPRFDPDRARALLSEAGYADGRCPRRDRALASRAMWEDAGVRRGRPARGRSAFEFDFSASASDPDGLAAIRQRAAHAWLWAWSADLPDPGGGSFEPILRSEPWLYRDRAARAAAGSRGLAPRPGRAPAHLSRVRTQLDRRARGRRSDRVRGPPVVATPVGQRECG